MQADQCESRKRKQQGRMMRQAVIGEFRRDRSQQKKPGRDAQRPIALPRLSAVLMNDSLGRRERQTEFSLQFLDRDEVHIVSPKVGAEDQFGRNGCGRCIRPRQPRRPSHGSATASTTQPTTNKSGKVPPPSFIWPGSLSVGTNRLTLIRMHPKMASAPVAHGPKGRPPMVVSVNPTTKPIEPS